MRLQTSLLLAASLVLATGATAQTIAGRTYDRRSHLSTRGVTVTVLGDSGHVVATTSTDTSGIFYAMLPSAGRFLVRFTVDSTHSYDADSLTVGPDEVVQREFALPIARVYFEFEVSKQVTVRSGSEFVKYPPELKAANVEGEVLVQFVVDTAGKADMGTFRVLRASDGRFVPTVRGALPRMLFFPAEIGGRKVRQMVQQPFTFSLSNFPTSQRASDKPAWTVIPPIPRPPL